MILGFERKVEEMYIDLDKMGDDGKIDRNVRESPNGYYLVVIIPKYLIGKTVVILPLSDNGTPEHHYNIG